MSKIVAGDGEMGEEDRLAVLRGLGALDSDSDPHFDRIVRLAAALFGAPRAAIALIDRDRLWHKAILGLPRREYPRAGSLADVMMQRGEAVISADVRADPRFADSLHTMTQVDVRFYAAAPLVTPDGAMVGLLAVGDVVAHDVGDDSQLVALRDLAALASELLITNARRLAAERGQSADQMRRILALEAGEIGELEWDAASDTLFIDDRIRHQSGLSWSADAGHGGLLSFRFIHEEDRDRARAEVEEQLQRGDRYRVEYRIRRQDTGEVRRMVGAGAVLRDEAGATRKIVGVVRDITQEWSDAARREALQIEMDHRVGQAISLAAALAARAPGDLAARLAALEAGRAHQARAGRTGGGLEALVASELGEVFPGQAVWSGPDLCLTAAAAGAMARALNELSANAARFGALSCDGGRVLVDWRKRPDGGFAFDWTETGGPAVETPLRTGQGADFIERSLGRELGGVGQITYAREGLRVVITAGPAALATTSTPTVLAAAPTAAPGLGVRGLKLMIVEDATLLALELEAGLIEAGAEIIGAAGDVAEALVLAEGGLDAAVLDVNLGGQLVTPVAERLQARGIPFVFATGYGERGAPAGFAVPIVRKPYNIQQIVRAVADAVAGHDTGVR